MPSKIQTDKLLNRIYSDMSCVGVNLVAPREESSSFVDIEKTLIQCAAVLGESKDGRLLSLVFSWLDMHSKYVIVEKLKKLTNQYEQVSPEPLVWLSSFGHYCWKVKKQHKWKAIASKYPDEHYLEPQELSKIFIEKNGNYPWLEGTGISIAEGTIRFRRADIMTASQLSETNHQFKNRLKFGPAWRADIVMAIEKGAKTSGEIRELVGCSAEPARRILNDYMQMFNGAITE